MFSGKLGFSFETQFRYFGGFEQADDRIDPLRLPPDDFIIEPLTCTWPGHYCQSSYQRSVYPKYLRAHPLPPDVVR
jgi:hypothetical protein